jgi:hypothetical protein
LIVVQHDLTAVARQNQLIGYRLAMLTEIEQLQIEPDEAAPINNLFKPSHLSGRYAVHPQLRAKRDLRGRCSEALKLASTSEYRVEDLRAEH